MNRPVKSFSQALTVLVAAGLALPVPPAERQADGMLRWKVDGVWLTKAEVKARAIAYVAAQKERLV